MKIPELIKIGEGRWISLTEYPDDTLHLEGIQEHPEEPRTYIRHGLRFSRDALAEMIPHIQEWLDTSKKVPFSRR